MRLVERRIKDLHHLLDLRMGTKLLQLVVLVLSTFLFCQSGFSDDRLTVFVSIAPQKYFVQQIGMNRVNIQVMVNPGASPATYEPKPKQMTTLSKARVYFAHTYNLEQFPIEREGKSPKPSQ